MIRQELWASLFSMDPEDVDRRSLARYEETSAGYKLPILGHDYIIIPKDQIIRQVGAPPSSSPEYYLQVSTINYLIRAQDIPLSHEWVNEKQFPQGPFFFRGPHQMPVRDLERAFGQDLDSFSRSCLACGGREVEEGDLTYELPMFPRIPVRLILWQADDEFPARVSFLFDKTADRHLRLDALWAVGKAIEESLTGNLKTNS